jgi:integrase
MRRRKQPRAAVKLPKGVHKVTSRGHEYYYFQAGRGTAAQGPRIQLPNDYESPEFWAALREAQGKSSVPIVNTVNLVADEYLAAASPSLSASSFDHYQRALGIAKKAWGDLALDGVRPAHVKKLMEGMATTPAKANQFLSVMKVFSGWSLVSDKIAQSLTEGVKPYKTGGGHKPWSDAQIAVALAKLTGNVRKGFVLYLYTGQRGSDIVRLGWTDVDDGGFNIKQAKTGVEVWCPIVAELDTEMSTWERRPGPFLFQSSGETFDRTRFWKHFTAAIENIPELDGVTLHGLRATIGTINRYCRFADKKSGGKAALITLDDHRTSKAKREGGNVK